ncbi:MAG TPA: cytochrome c oxidase subunit I, partial [Bacteroidia bacterium]
MAEHAQDHHHDHDDHHEESFITKYVFSQDHKMISRQFLITAIVMAVVAMTMSILFRLQLAWPGEKFAFIHWMLGDRWGKDGILDPNMYLALVTIHGT